MPSLKKMVLKYLPVHYFLFHKSYAQEGEDMVLRSFFEGKKAYKGFYVDVGAHHPYRFSNTLFFYKRGWKGINIEPTPSAAKYFKWFRRRDINLNIGISDKKGLLKFYCFNDPALNGFSKALSEERDRGASAYKITREIDIPTLPLSVVLEQHVPASQKIDFLTIDVEGLDLTVLQSNNWEIYKPGYILVEDRIDFDDLNQSEIYTYLSDKGYSLVAKTLRTLFFKLN